MIEDIHPLHLLHTHPLPLHTHPLVTELETRWSTSELVRLRRTYSYALRLRRIANVLLKYGFDENTSTRQRIYYANAIHLMTLPLIKNSIRFRSESRRVRLAFHIVSQITTLLNDESSGFDKTAWDEWIARL